jgi:Flp pilus assembly protein TadD
LTKRKRKKQRKERPARRPPRSRGAAADLERSFRQAQTLIDQGRAREAVDLLQPLAASHPRQPQVHYNLGYAQTQAGDLWDALSAFKRALNLSRDPGYWPPLALTYAELGLTAHAVRAFHQVRKYELDGPELPGMLEAVASLQQRIRDTADHLGLPLDRVERGLRYFEEGQRTLHLADYPACIANSERATKFLGDWPPPRNNLSLALFFDGQPARAIATARRVLDHDPGNVQALGNAIQYLAWTGKTEEARGLWARLRAITPEEHDPRLKAAEAAAVMDDDEHVLEMLQPLRVSPDVRPDVPGLDQRARFFLAVAEANLGKRSALRRMKALLPEMPWIENFVQALQAGRPGPGWADRFPYFHSTDMMPAQRMHELLELLQREDRMPPQRFRREMERFAERFPQLALMAEKFIWEDREPEAGMAILVAVGTPPAHAALRRFGLSQAGDDDQRMQALYKLADAGQIPPDETLRVWQQGAWHEIQVRRYEISDEPRDAYPPEIGQLLHRGQQAFQDGDLAGAEEMFRRMRELEPRAKEAYNNLGTVFARREQHERAQEMFRAALELDPLYVFPRCNLALYLLDDDLEAAMDMIQPLADLTRFHPQEAALYSYVQARIFLAQDDPDRARNALEAALEVWPDHELSQQLLARLEIISPARTFFSSFFERRRRRDQAWRVRLQAKLTSPHPSLAGALPLLTREALTATGRQVLTGGGWSALRKAELVERLVQALPRPETLEHVASGLSDEERDALRQVLARGGHMPWHGFDAEYGNDLDESRFWQWHEPRTTMGRLRLRGLLVEATVDGELLVAIPLELRQALHTVLE